MFTDGTSVLPTLCDVERHAAEIHAELHACRIALVQSIRRDPDNVEERELLWLRLFELKRAAGNTLDRIKDALDDAAEPVPANAMKLCGLKRADGSTYDVPMSRLSWCYSATEPGWCPGDPLPGVTVPASERERLPDLTA